MRKLVVGTFLTLDGVMQAPGGPQEDSDDGFAYGGWLVPYLDDRFERIMVDWTTSAGAFLLGRKTYEIFANSWPNATDPADQAATALNSLPKFVASRTLRSVEWTNSTLLRGDVDTLRLWQFPVVLGTGKRLFAEGTIPRSFRLDRTEVTDAGAVFHVYERVGGIRQGELEVGHDKVIFDES